MTRNSAVTEAHAKARHSIRNDNRDALLQHYYDHTVRLGMWAHTHDPEELERSIEAFKPLPEH